MPRAEEFKLHKDSFEGWGWRRMFLPPETLAKNNTIVPIMRVKVVYPTGVDLNCIRGHPVVLITGDGDTLPTDTREFESWGIPHDLYAVNRSLIFHERKVDHWAAVDLEETIWFAENVNSSVAPGNHHIVRHTIGEVPVAADVCWEMDYEWENENQKLVFGGNSGYFAVLTAIFMGYQKIVVAGMPLNRNPHWYENKQDYVGPNWNGACYTNWMDFKMQSPDADKVKSMSGYSAFILGNATREWLNG